MPNSAGSLDYQRAPPDFTAGFDRRQLADQLSTLFSDRASFELNEEDVIALRRSLHLSSRDSLTALRRSLEASRPDPSLQGEFAAWQARHPCALQRFSSIAQRARGKRLAVFLDYDGTLTPIVKNPDEAFMTEQMRDIVRQLAQLFPTAIISGRGRDKLENFVQLKEMFYAGSHGLDIVGPRDPSNPDEQFAFQPAARFESTMNSVYNMLNTRLQSIPGASVEHNKFCVSAHFRNCCPESWEGVLAAVQTTVAEHPELKFSKGRKVLEIKPQVDWDKGTALTHLLDALGLDDSSNVLPIYIGDDQTDEDAFRVLRLRSDGLGILVSSKAKPTAATYALQDPVAVSRFLSQLVAWGHTPDNDWQSCRGCNGWELDQSAAASQTPDPHSPFWETDPKANGLPNGWRHAPSGNTISESVHDLPSRGGSAQLRSNGNATNSQDAGPALREASQKSPSATCSGNNNKAASKHEGSRKHLQPQSASSNGNAAASQHAASQQLPRKPAQQLQEAQEALRQQLTGNGSGKLQMKSADGPKRRPDWKWDQPLDTWLHF
ncbi:hypothetical protein WJX74_005534 [Apatococcus lobatus]|uniref:Trehalose 6-phosphate phosphatase n=1 Tax=Apatococcus lobatus TaxID=904363 RepID=A0AAW1QH85_9CHLO